MFKGTDWPSVSQRAVLHSCGHGAKERPITLWRSLAYPQINRLQPKETTSHFHAISFFVQINDTFKASSALCFHWQFPFCQATTSRSKTRIPRCSQSTRLRFARLPRTWSWWEREVSWVNFGISVYLHLIDFYGKSVGKYTIVPWILWEKEDGIVSAAGDQKVHPHCTPPKECPGVTHTCIFESRIDELYIYICMHTCAQYTFVIGNIQASIPSSPLLSRTSI